MTRCEHDCWEGASSKCMISVYLPHMKAYWEPAPVPQDMVMEALGAAGSVESFKGPPKVLENHWALGKAAHARGEHVPPFPCSILQTNLFPAESLSAHILKPFGPLVFAPHILKPFALGVRQGKMEMWFEWEPPWWFFNAKPLSCIAHLLAIRRSWLDCTEEDTPGLVCCGAPKWVPNCCDSSCRTFAMGKGPCSRDPRRSKSNRRSACVQKRYLPNHRRSFAFSHMLCIYVYCIVYSMFIYPHAMYPQGPYTVYPDLFIFCIHIGCTRANNCQCQFACTYASNYGYCRGGPVRLKRHVCSSHMFISFIYEPEHVYAYRVFAGVWHTCIV